VEKFVREFSWPGGFSHLYPGIRARFTKAASSAMRWQQRSAQRSTIDRSSRALSAMAKPRRGRPLSMVRHEVSIRGEAVRCCRSAVNGWISNPTIFGSMSDDELRALLRLRLAARFVIGDDLSATAFGDGLGVDEIGKIQARREAASRSRSRVGRC
jgi:hypothetical protein